MSQTAVNDQVLGRAGDKADSMFDDCISRAAEGDLFIGRLAVLGTDPDTQAVHPDATGEVSDGKSQWGVVLRTLAMPSSLTGDPKHLDKDAVTLKHKGRVFVEVEEAVVPTDPVFVRFAAGGGGTKLGSFRKSADTATAVALAAGQARYVSSAGAGEIAILEVNFT